MILVRGVLCVTMTTAEQQTSKMRTKCCFLLGNAIIFFITLLWFYYSKQRQMLEFSFAFVLHATCNSACRLDVKCLWILPIPLATYKLRVYTLKKVEYFLLSSCLCLVDVFSSYICWFLLCILSGCFTPYWLLELVAKMQAYFKMTCKENGNMGPADFLC